MAKTFVETGTNSPKNLPIFPSDTRELRAEQEGTLYLLDGNGNVVQASTTPGQVEAISAAVAKPASTLIQDSTHRLVSDSQIEVWTAGQSGLVPMGEWNPGTNIPAAETTLTEVGQYLFASVDGTYNSKVVKKGQKIVRTTAGLVVDTSTAVPIDQSVDEAKLSASVTAKLYQAQITAEQAKGISRLKLTSPLSFIRLNPTPDVPTSIVQTAISATEISTTGYGTSASEVFVLYDTTSAANVARNVLLIRTKINSFGTANPAIGLAWGSLQSAVGYVIRSGGQLVRLAPDNINGQTIGNFGSGFTFGVGDEVGIDLFQENGTWKVQAYKNGVLSTSIALNPADSPTTGNILVCCRGSVGFSYIVRLQNDPPPVQKSIQYTNDKLLPVNEALQTLLEEAEYSSSSSNHTVGINNPVLGVSTGTGTTRIAITPIPSMTGIITLAELELWATAAGTIKLKIASKSGNNYTLVKEVALTVAIGKNLFNTNHFGENFTLVAGQYFGFHSTAGASVSGVLMENTFPSLNFLQELTGTATPSNSALYELQFKATLTATDRVTLKERVTELSSAETSQNEQLNALSEGVGSVLEGLGEVQQGLGIVKSKVNYATVVSTVLAGLANPALATSMSVVGTRVDTTYPIPPFIGTGTMSQVQVYCNVGGAGKVKLLARNQDNTYRLIQDFPYTFVEGLNTVPVNFVVQPGWLVGFYSSIARFSGVDVTVVNSVNLTGDATGNAIPVMGTSSYRIQYKATINVAYTPEVKTEIEALKKKARPVFYVNTGIGNDANSGESTAPFATIQKAINEAIGQRSTIIIIDTGDYRETLNFSAVTFEDIRLVKQHKAVVRVMGSVKLEGWTKTPGYTNLYECAFAGPMPAWDHDTQNRKCIFEDFNPSEPILAEDRHPLQQGLTHYLPYTLIGAIGAGANLGATLTSLDSTPGRYYFNAGKLYLHSSTSTDPNANGFAYEVGARNWNIPPLASNRAALGSITLQGIDFYYSLTGFIASGFASLVRRFCSAFGALTTGNWRDDGVAYLESIFCRAHGSGGDGENGHYGTYYSDHVSQNKAKGRRVARYVGSWCTHNWDDGHSDHERGISEVTNCLFEFNGDRGWAPAQGCQATAISCTFQKNGWATDANDGGGASVVNVANDGLIGTIAKAIGCLSRKNLRGYCCQGAGNEFYLSGCRSEENQIAELYAYSSGKIFSRDTAALQPDAMKLKATASDGQIQFKNSNVLIAA